MTWEPSPDSETRPVSARSPALLAIVFFVMMGTGMMFPLLATVAERFGGGAAEAGLLLSAFAAARLLANLPAGVAADRFGRRPAMAFGLLLLAAGSFSACFVESVAGLALSILLIGAGSSTALTAALAVFADLSTSADRGRQMSRYQSAVLVGISMGPVTGGLLSGRIDLMAPFALQGILSLLGCATTLIALPRRFSRDGAAGQRAPSLRSLMRIFSSPAFAIVSLLFFTMFLTRTATNWQLVPIIVRDRFGFSPEAIGLLLTSGALANLAAQPVVGRLIDGWGAAKAVIVGAAGVVAALFLLALGGDPWTMCGGVVALGAAGGVLGPAINASAIGLSDDGRGATLGALRTAGDAGLVLGPLMLGQFLVGAGLSHQQGVLIGALAMASSFALYLAFVAARARD